MKRWMILALMTTACSVFSQPGFVKGYADALQTSADFQDVVIDNDTIVLYSLAWDDNWVQGIRFSRLDTFGNILNESMYIDSTLTLTTQAGRKKIIKTKDNGYAILGSAGLPTLYLLKVNHDLSLDFLKKYVVEDSMTLLNASLIEVSDGFLLLGDQRIDTINHEIFVTKTDIEGNVVWWKVYDAGPNMQSNPLEMHALDDNTYVIGAVHSLSKDDGIIGTWNRSYMLCIDSLGNVKWDWESDDAPDHSWIADFELLADSSWICMSGTWEFCNDSYATKPMVFRRDKNFNMIWEKVFDVPCGGFQLFTDLEKLPDSNYLVTGQFFDWNAQKYKGVHYKFAPNGDSLWMRWDTVFWGDSDTYITGTDILSSGSIISVGYGKKKIPDVGGYGTFGFVMKLSPDGCIDTLNCWPVASTAPFAEEKEVAVYPNPFGDYLTVSLPGYPQNAYIYFYDITGRFLRKERIRNGTNELDVSDFPKGMVFYEVRDGVVRFGRGEVVKK